METKKIAVDIDKKLHKKFSQIVHDIGTKKKVAVHRMIEDFVLNAEANPGYFRLLKARERRNEI